MRVRSRRVGSGVDILKWSGLEISVLQDWIDVPLFRWTWMLRFKALVVRPYAL